MLPWKFVEVASPSSVRSLQSLQNLQAASNRSSQVPVPQRCALAASSWCVRVGVVGRLEPRDSVGEEEEMGAWRRLLLSAGLSVESFNVLEH